MSERDTFKTNEEQVEELEALVDALSELDLWRSEDPTFDDEVAVTAALFAAGQITAPDAAARLGLSLEEFVRDFVLDDGWLAGCEENDSGARAERAHELAAVLNRARDGITLHDFRWELLATLQPALLEAVCAVDPAATQPLGLKLRKSIGSGKSLDHFVAAIVFPDSFLREICVPEEQWAGYRARAVDDLRRREEYVWNASWFTALASTEIADTRSVEALDRALTDRRIGDASHIIAAHRRRRLMVSPGQPNAAKLLWCYARWIQFDFSYLPLVEDAHKRFAQLPPRLVPPEDVLCLGLVETIIAFHRERYDAVLQSVAIAREVPLETDAAKRMRAWYAFFEANVYWKNGRYENARRLLKHALRRLGNFVAPCERATFELLYGWLIFLRGRKTAARCVLDCAERAFAGTDDHLTKGDILSFRGRLDRDLGTYGAARKAFARSIESYSMVDPMHPNIGRSHINLAITICHQLHARGVLNGRARLVFLRKAMQHLDAADALYRSSARPNGRGVVKVHVTKARVYHAAQEWDRAERHAAIALKHAEQLQNPLLIADAKGVWAMTCASPEEMVQALGDARRYAGRTDNRQVKANALQLSSEAADRLPEFGGSEQAEGWREQANRILTKGERDYEVFSATLRAVTKPTAHAE
jgi:tetratricopeptide (TPR) repeat protein